MESRAIKCTMRDQLAGTGRQIAALETQLHEALLTLEKLTGESSRMETDFSAQVVAVVGVLNVEIARVKLLKRDVTAEAKKRHQLPSNRRETRKTASPRLTEDVKSLQALQSKVATVTAELREWLVLATITAEELKVATSDVVLEARLLKAAREEMVAQTTNVLEL